MEVLVVTIFFERQTCLVKLEVDLLIMNTD